MIRVIGGVYWEHCLQPGWHQLYGSAGRAAAALAKVSDKVSLHTYVDARSRRELEARAASFGFDLVAASIPTTVLFDYVHPLSVPVIDPPPHMIDRAPSLQCDGDVVLRFGMMEADARVKGTRVIYDPQSATKPERFKDNGSTAEHLAIVANAYEVRLLTGTDDPIAGARQILATEGAEVVVVKRGGRGALVVTPTAAETVPAYRTNFVFTIGSGDMFAAAFAHFWGEQQLPAKDAADLASRATAQYCETQSVSLSSQSDLASAPLVPVTASSGCVYLAGPFFNLPQRWMIEEARVHLRSMGLDVFSPLHDVGPGAAEVVARADLKGLERCDRMLALVDGADTGTLFEVGYARSRNMPVVALSETLADEQLKMLVGTDCVVTNDFATAIFKTAWL